MQKQRKIVLVKWNDSCARSGWKNEEMVKDYETASILSVGFQIKRTKQKIVLAISHETGKDNDDVADTVTIPMGCVKAVETIRKEKI